MFYQDEYVFTICSIFVRFTKQIYNIKDQKDLRYVNGCALIRHFKQSLIMMEIFAKARYSDEGISEDQRKVVEQEILVKHEA
jgi:hypothetical protein